MVTSFAVPSGPLSRLFRRLSGRLLPAPESTATTIADAALTPLFARAREKGTHLIASTKTVHVGRWRHSIPKFIVSGDTGATRHTEVGIFGGLDACSLDTVLAVGELIHRCDLDPSLVKDYSVAAFPKANVEAFTDSCTHDDFQSRAAQHPEDEDASFLRNEIKNAHFSLIVRLRSDENAEHFHAKVRGEIIARTVVSPSLQGVSGGSASEAATIELLSNHRLAHLAASHSNCLSTATSRGSAVEVELFAPGSLPFDERTRALADITLAMLANYRSLLSINAML
jgi:hypothetical protein